MTKITRVLLICDQIPLQQDNALFYLRLQESCSAHTKTARAPVLSIQQNSFLTGYVANKRTYTHSSDIRIRIRILVSESR